MEINYFRCPKIYVYLSLIMCLHIGTPKNINFPFGSNGKLMFLGVLILIKALKGIYVSMMIRNLSCTKIVIVFK